MFIKIYSLQLLKLFGNTCAIIFLLFQIIIESAQAQFNQLHFGHFTTLSGLSQGDVSPIFQDSRGFIWFSTFDGLNRFDGYNFQVFKPSYNDSNSIEGEHINYVLEDKHGMLWVGTNEALNCYNYKTGFFKHYHISNELNEKLKVIYQPVFIDDKNELWFSYANNLASMNLLTGKFTTYPFAKGEMQKFIAVDYPSNKMYRHLSKIYTTCNDGLHIIDLDNKKTVYYFSANNKNDYGKPTLIYQVLEDKNHILWLGSLNGLLEFNLPIKQTETYNQFQTKNVTETFFLAQDKDENLWCSGSNGLYVFNTTIRKFIKHYSKNANETESLSQNLIDYIFIDKNNNIWIGVDPVGVDKINPYYEQLNCATLNSEQKGINDVGSVSSISAIDSNHILVCSNHKNFIVYNKITGENKKINLPEHFNKSTSNNNAIVDSYGKIWMASDSGLLKTDANFHFFKKILSNNLVDAYFFECNKRLYIGTTTNLLSVSLDEQLNHADTIHVFDGKKINFIGKSPDGFLCVATSDKEFFWIRTESNKAGVVKKINFNFIIKSFFFQTQDILFLATNAGLARFIISKNSLKVFTEKDGLANNYVYCVLKGNDDRLWMSTNHGISRFDINTEHFTNYGIAEGAQALEFNTHSFYQSPAGIIYFGGVNGFNYFNPLQIKDFAFNPPLQLLNVTINDNNTSLEKFLGEEPVRLKSNENNISIEFAAIDFNRNDNIDYLYKIQDDNKWISIGNKRTLNFANLSPGNYNVEVEAQYSYNEISPHVLRFAFTILPPFYETYWFIALVCIAFIFIIYSLYKYRINQIKKLYAVRAKISKDLHDDIGSTLGSISIYSEVAKKRSEKHESADEAITKIGSASRELIDKMSDIVWSINPKNESFEQLLNRMQAFAASMLTPHEIYFNIYADEAVKKIKLTTEQRKNIYLIYKEAIHNIIKHAECPEVEIKMLYRSNTFFMVIKDNGKGFDINKVQLKNESLGGNGIKNMVARAESIHGDLCFDSMNTGTKIELKLKV